MTNPIKPQEHQIIPNKTKEEFIEAMKTRRSETTSKTEGTNKPENANIFQRFIDGLDIYSALAERLKGICKPPAAWGIATAIVDFTRICKISDAGEEHRTSSLMGYIGSSMGTFYRLASLDDPTVCSDRFSWYASRKRSKGDTPGEANHGIDFGVAVYRGKDTLRVCLLQAKLATPKHTIGIETKVTSNSKPKIAAKAARNRLHKWADLGEKPDAFTKVRANVMDYQIYKMASIQEYIRDNFAFPKQKRHQFTHYVFWNDGEPTCISLDLVKEKHLTAYNNWLANGEKGAKPSITNLIYPAKDAPQSINGSMMLSAFSELLAKGLAEKTEDGWIEVVISPLTGSLLDFTSLSDIWYFATNSEVELKMLLGKDLDISPIGSTQYLAPAPAPAPGNSPKAPSVG